MSLINQMLQDLDNRRAAHGVGSTLPNDVRPLPQQRASRMPIILGSVVFVALLGGFVFYQFGGLNALPHAGPVPTVSVSPLPAAPPEPQAQASLTEAAVGSPPSASPLQELDGSLRLADSLALPLGVPAEIKSEATPELKSELKAVAKPKAQVLAGNPVVEAKEPLMLSDRVVQSEPLPKSEAAPKASGKPAKAGAIERSDVAVSPRERAESDYRKAIAALNQGRLEEAIDDLHHALRQDVLHSASRQLLIKLLLDTKRTDEAIQELQDGLHVQPAQLAWAMSLARLQVSRGDLNGAWKSLEFSMPAAGSNADYQGFSGHVLHRLGRDKESAEHYQIAARLSPTDGRWWLGLGLALDAEGRSSEAREALLRARKSGNLGPELMALIEQRLR